ncbi:MAG: hypothetical protein JOY80_00775 [Candidatus Dormibacteraeota bacterium]|nr:hypothetical protein [Candidatus Dormibacteraeota bacterium]
MSGWRVVEVYGTFIKVTGELELVGSERLSDTVNRYGSFLHVRNARSEPLSVNYPVLSRVEPRVTVSKASIILVCPVDEDHEGSSTMWRETVIHPAAFNTAAFSMVGDVHLEPSHDLEDHLQRHPGDFLPVTNVSALWITTISTETHALQRPFALLNPTAILSFTLR